jgi:SAM-dependent methyltransferase
MRGFYDWFSRYYGIIERSITKNIAAAVAAVDPAAARFAQDSVLDLCCGSGSLALAVAPRSASYQGRDQSEAMLRRARKRWRRQFGNGAAELFVRSNVLDFADPADSVDRVLMAYALHLFSPEVEIDLLGRFLHAARRSVIVFDHGTAPNPLLSLVEAAEGSWYEEYRRIDFAAAAAAMGAQLSERAVRGVRVMEFTKMKPGGR